MEILYIIPARGGSKGILKKNIKALNGKPLIGYTIDFAKQVAENKNIYVTTDSEEIAQVAESFALTVPFLRPAALAGDTAGMHEVIIHAIEHYETVEKKEIDAVMLLQPTSPFRKVAHHNQMVQLLHKEVDMVVSVFESPLNPYYTLFEENALGYLSKSKKANFERRQDAPKVYAYNGSMYLIWAGKLKSQPLHTLKKIVKYVMEDIYSVDIDTHMDWLLAEAILDNNLLNENC